MGHVRSDPERRRALVTATRFLEQARAGGSTLDWNDRYISTTTPGQRYAGTFVGGDGRNFMLGAGANIFIGAVVDLPGGGAGLKPGASISFEAGHAAVARQDQSTPGFLELARTALAAHRQFEDERLPTPIAGRQVTLETPPGTTVASKPGEGPKPATRPRKPGRDPGP